MKIIAFFCLVGVLTACAPAAESISRGSSELQQGPRLDDVDLKLTPVSPDELNVDSAGELTAAATYRLAENILVMKGTHTDERRGEWATCFLKDVPHDRSRLSNSAYAEILVDQSHELAKESLDDVIPKLKAAPKTLRRVLDSIRAPGEASTLEELAKGAFEYLKTFEQKVRALDLMKEIKSGVRREIGKYLDLQDDVRRAVRDLSRADTIVRALSDVSKTAKSFGVSISSSQQEKIDRARRLGAKVDAIGDARSALSALVDVWVYLAPQKRTSVFHQASPELYDYFKDLTDDDLRCLQDTDCFNLPQWVARNLVIEPKIEAYGIDRLRSQINSEGASGVRDEVRQALQKELKDLPRTISDRIEKSIEQKSAPITRLAKDFSGEMKGRLDKWAADRIEKNQPSIFNVKHAKARFRIAPSGRFEIDWSDTEDTNATENAGAWSSLGSRFWKSGLLSSADSRMLILTEIASLAHQYRDMGSLSAVAKPKIATARAYAEAIRGAANLSIAFRDWEPNAVDALVGEYRARELFPEFDLPELDQPLFPKTAFFALGFSSLAEHLRVITGEKTQVFLIGPNNRIVLANEPAPESDSPVMAGIADRIGSELSSTVRAEDVARYLISMCETLTAAQDVERSNSDYLLKVGSDGKIPRDEIIKNRESIRLLVLGLANYLSHQFRAGGELIHHELSLATQLPISQTFSVLDQVLAVRALTAASTALGNEIYHWEAVDLVSTMNRRLYRKELTFYGQPGEKSVSPAVVLETIRALDEVSPYLRPASRAQVEALTAPWRARIASWRLTD